MSDITDPNEDRKKLEKQYSSLKRYAHINSHQVRAHVSTMLGLTTLCIDQLVTDEEKEKVLRHLHDETLKLDRVIRDLALLIDQET